MRHVAKLSQAKPAHNPRVNPDPRKRVFFRLPNYYPNAEGNYYPNAEGNYYPNAAGLIPRDYVRDLCGDRLA